MRGVPIIASTAPRTSREGRIQRLLKISEFFVEFCREYARLPNWAHQGGMHLGPSVVQEAGLRDQRTRNSPERRV